MTQRLTFLAALAALTLVTSGCATILKGGKNWSQVQFRETPALEGDQRLQLWVDGKPMEWKMAFSGVGYEHTSTSATVDLNNRMAHTVKARLGGCETEFRVTPSISGWWIVLDLTVGLGIGIIVDAVTGAWKEFDSTILYTPDLMAKRGTPVPGQTPMIPCGTAS